MGATIDRGMYLIIAAAGQNYRSFAHIGLHKVAPLLNLAIMTKKQPGLTKYALLLKLIYVPVSPAAAADQGGIIVHQFTNVN
jgi:hypothetical protein